MEAEVFSHKHALHELEEVANHMEKDRRGIRQAVDAAQVFLLQRVELMAVANQQVALQYGYGQAAQESAKTDQQAGKYAEHRANRRQIGLNQISSSCRHNQGNGETFPGQVQVGGRHDLALAEVERDEIMNDIIKLRQHD